MHRKRTRQRPRTAYKEALHALGTFLCGRRGRVTATKPRVPTLGHLLCRTERIHGHGRNCAPDCTFGCRTSTGFLQWVQMKINGSSIMIHSALRKSGSRTVRAHGGQPTPSVRDVGAPAPSQADVQAACDCRVTRFVVNSGFSGFSGTENPQLSCFQWSKRLRVPPGSPNKSRT